MKKIKSGCFYSILIFFIALTLNSCTVYDMNGNDLIGIWEHTEVEELVEFTKQQTGAIAAPGVFFYFCWSVNPSSEYDMWIPLKIVFDNPDTDGTETKWLYKFTDVEKTKLTLKMFDDDNSFTYVKK